MRRAQDHGGGKRRRHAALTAVEIPPSPATFTANPKERTLEINGVAPRAGVPLTVWIPGAGEPEVKGEGLENARLNKVPGGWMLEAAPIAGPWRLSVRGRD